MKYTIIDSDQQSTKRKNFWKIVSCNWTWLTEFGIPAQHKKPLLSDKMQIQYFSNFIL